MKTGAQRYKESAAYREISKASSRRYYKKHHEVIRARAAAYYATEKGQDVRYKNYYGISLTEYRAMIEKQHGECAICHKLPKEKLQVDHSHATNKVRGLVCKGCNIKIAWLESYYDEIVSHMEGGE